jgi:NNP family nitrate/nitrite transporter-like MFS transporter
VNRGSGLPRLFVNLDMLLLNTQLMLSAGYRMNYWLVFLFWALWYFNYLSRILLSPLLPLIEDALTINHTLAGGLYFPFYLGSTLAVICGGFFSLRIGYKKIILFCFLILSVSFFLLSLCRTYQFFIVTLFFLGLGSGLYIPCAIPLLTAVIDKDHWGKAISLHETAAGCAIMTVPFLTALALRFMAWYSIFFAMGLIMVVAIFFLLAFSPDPSAVSGKPSQLSDLLRRRNFWLLLTVFVTCGIASMGIFNIVPLFLVKEKNIPINLANTLFGVSRVGGFLAMIVVGFVLDRFNVKKMSLALILLTGISTIGIALVDNYHLLFTMLVSQATFSVVFFPVGLVMISKVTTQRERGVFTGIAIGAAGIVGPGLSPLILGAMADVWSFTIGILGVGILTTLSGFCLYWFDDASGSH